MAIIDFLKTRYLFVCLMSLMCLACAKGPDQGKPVFPEMKYETIAGSDVYVLEFHAQMPWMLQSSAPWVRFVDNGMKVYDISGYAGDVKVEIEISDNGQTFEEEHTVVKLRMGNYTEGILTITRTAREHMVILRNAAGDIVDKLEIYDDFTAYTVQANFAFISSLPSQVEFSSNVAGQPLEKRGFEARIGEEYLTRPIQESDGVQLVVKTAEGDIVKGYPVVYKGIDDNFIRVNAFEGTRWYENDLYQSVVYPDGVTFRGGSPAGGKYDRNGNEVPGTFYYFSDYAELQVIALNDSFRFVSFESDLQGNIVLNQAPWIHASVQAEDPRIVHVTADASEDYRVACVLAVPDGLYGQVIEQVKDGGDYQKVKLKLKSMILAEFIQCNPENLDLDLRDGVHNWNRLHGCKVHTEDTPEGKKLLDDANLHLNGSMSSDYPRLSRAYEAWVNAGTSVIAFPRYRESSLEAGNAVFNSYKVYDSFWKEDTQMMKDSYAGLWDDWYMYYAHFLTLPSDRDYVYVVFRTADGLEDKILKLNIRK